MKYFLTILFVITYRYSVGQCSKEEVNKLRKTALIIGENNYSAEPLSNPVNDASDVSRALNRLGFKIKLDTNVNYSQLSDDIEKWSSNLDNFDIAVFYFAGHGAEIDGENYIFPTNADFSTGKVKKSTYLVSSLLKRMESSNDKINIILLDACRNDPTRSFKKSITRRGLKEMSSTKRGILIGFPVAAGKTTLDGAGRNSIYTQAILKNIEIPNISINEIFSRVIDDVDVLSYHQQMPFIYSSIGNVNNYCLKCRIASSKSIADVAISDTIISENLEKYRNDISSDSDALYNTETTTFTKAKEIIGLGIQDVWDSVGLKCKCGTLSAYQDNNFLAHSFENTDGFSSTYYRIEFRALIKGQIKSNEFIFSIQSNGNRSDKLLPLEKTKGLNHEEVLIEPVSSIDWNKVRSTVSRFFFLRLEMLK